MRRLLTGELGTDERTDIDREDHGKGALQRQDPAHVRAGRAGSSAELGDRSGRWEVSELQTHYKGPCLPSFF